MYDFHYNYIKWKYEDKAKLLFTDTDSLMYEIETKDFYKDISADIKRRIDTSNSRVRRNTIVTVFLKILQERKKTSLNFCFKRN